MDVDFVVDGVASYDRNGVMINLSDCVTKTC